MFIYKIKNHNSGGIYIGQTTTSIDRRFKEHVRKLKNNVHPNQYLQNSWNKYGEDGWIIELLETCNTLEELNLKESFYIDHLTKNNNVLYNIRSGGDGGGTHSENTKRKISKKTKQQWNINGDKLRCARKNQWSDENKHSLSNSIKKLWSDPNYRLKQTSIRNTQTYKDNHRRGILNSKELISKSVSDRWKDENYKKTVSETIKKSLSDPEIKSKHVAANKKNRSCESYKQKHRDAVKLALSDPLVREKISKSKSKYFGRVLSPDNQMYEVYGLRAFCRTHNLDYSGFRKIKHQLNYSYKGWSYINESNT